MKLTTLSPIFIGGGASVLSIKSEEDFRKILESDKNLSEKWLNYFLNERSPSLVGFLNTHVGEAYLSEKFGYKKNKKTNIYRKNKAKNNHSTFSNLIIFCRISNSEL